MQILDHEITDSPRTHVYIIGVSKYLHFPDGEEPTANGKLVDMEQLSAAARSASEFAAWLMKDYQNPDAPLGSLRILLSHNGEDIHEDVAPLLTEDVTANIENFRQDFIGFRDASQTHTDNVTIVYVAGHGVQLSKNGAILLLTDCGSATHINLFDGAVDMSSMYASFDRANTSQTQFWFVDACRQKPDVASDFEDLESGQTFDQPEGNAKATSIFYAATTGKPAYARPNGKTLFWEAFEDGLTGNIAAEPEPDISNAWHVSTSVLVRELRKRVQDLAEEHDADQLIEGNMRFDDALFHEYEIAPDVDLSIHLDPLAAHDGSNGELLDNDDGIVAETENVWPLNEVVEAGIYKLKINTPNGFSDFKDFFKVKPTNPEPRIDVSQ